MEYELKPCPFCGQHAIMQTHQGLNWDGKDTSGIQVGAMYGLWYAGCPSRVTDELELKCRVAPSASWHAKQEEAVKQWNRRM